MPDSTHIRVVTPIISAGFRDDAPLEAALPDNCRVSSVFLENGPGSVESAVDEVLAAPGVINAALRAERDGADAVVIDCMLDPGLDATREAVSIPVIGCGEASISAAAKAGAFSIITVLDRQARAFRELARRYGLAGAIAMKSGKADARLGVVEALTIDAKHRLVLLRRDDREHLVMISPEGTTVIESGLPAAPATGIERK